MAPKFSGGVRQRLGLAKKAAVPRLKEDPVSAELVDLHSHGSLSAVQVGNLAAAGSSSSSSQAHQATFEPETKPRQPLKRLSRAKATPKAKTTGKLVKTKPRSVQTSMSLHRTLGHESPLHPLYKASIPVWSKRDNCKTTTTMAFLPIHEVLDRIVTDDNEPMWNTYEDHQLGFKERLREWGAEWSGQHA